MLDVAAGNGNATLAAARRWCDVTSTDYVPALLERGRAARRRRGLAVDFRQADAEIAAVRRRELRHGALDLRRHVHADQDKAAAELLRVCKPSGKIGLANWTPEGFIGQLFKTLGKHLPPPAGAEIAGAVGHARAADRDVRRRGARDQGRVAACSCSATARRQHWLDVFKTYYGPMLQGIRRTRAGETGSAARDLHALIVRMQPRGDGTMVVPAEYLEVVITKR